MNDPVTTRRRLSSELKRLRTERELTQRDVADRLDWSPSKVIWIEKGQVAVGITDLEVLLRNCRLDDHHGCPVCCGLGDGSAGGIRPRRSPVTLAAVNWLGSGHPRWPPDCPPTGCAAGSPSWSWRFAEFVVAQALLKAAAVAG